MDRGVFCMDRGAYYAGKGRDPSLHLHCYKIPALLKNPRHPKSPSCKNYHRHVKKNNKKFAFINFNILYLQYIRNLYI
jgi:hypothetical protein